MALHPLHIDHLPHLAHLPSYLDLSLRRFKTSDVAHISLNESLLTFPMEIGSLLHGVTVPSGSMVNPDTPAAQPPEGVASDEMLSAGAFICDATGSPVTIVKPIVFKEKISSYNSFTFSVLSILLSIIAPLPEGTSLEKPSF